MYLYNLWSEVLELFKKIKDSNLRRFKLNLEKSTDFFVWFLYYCKSY